MTHSHQVHSIGFDRLAMAAAKGSGSSTAFALAALLVIAWMAASSLFGFSGTWQLVIDTATTIVTFWMVFLIPARSKQGPHSTPPEAQ